MQKNENSRRHLALLIFILLLFAVSPFVVTFRRSGILVLNIFAVAVLVAGSYALRERKVLFVIAIALSAVSIIATWSLLVFPRHWVVIAAHSCIIVLLAFFSVTILGYVLRRGKVTSDKIFAAICVYILIGYAWTFVYAVLDEMQPRSFTATTEIMRNDYIERVMQLRYFSFMTLTTVGYGDILPRLPAVRTMAIFDAVMGQMYLAVLVARLVGLHIVHGDSSSRDRD